MELLKKSGIEETYDNYYFWRTHTGQEIDIIKETNGALTAIECKWANSAGATPSLWKEAYPQAPLLTVHKDNYLDMLIITSIWGYFLYRGYKLDKERDANKGSIYIIFYLFFYGLILGGMYLLSIVYESLGINKKW